MFAIKRRGFLLIVILFGYLNFAFCAQSEDLERIVISKSRQHLLGTYSIEPQDLEGLAFDSAVEALNIFPLDLQSRSPKGGIQTDFSLRGSNYQGVLFLVDGQRINDPQTGHHNSDIPLTKEDIVKIELIPGVASSLFGPDAIGGAVNFFTKKPKEKKCVLESSHGSFNTKSGLFSLTERIKDFGIRVSSEFEQSGGFSYDTDFTKYTATLSSALDVPYGEFNLDFGYQQKEFGAYDFYTPGSGYPSREWTKTYLLNAGFKADNAGLLIKPNFLWRRHFDKFMLDETGLRTKYLNQHRTDMYTPNIYFQKQMGFLGTTGLGLEYGEECIRSTNLGKHKRSHESIFFDDSKDLTSKLSLGLSGRLDDFDSFGQAYTGSINFRYRLFNEAGLICGVGRSIRIPTFTELYYNDPTTVGDPNLLEEKVLNYHVGCEFKKEEMSGGITFFVRQEDDMIDWIKHTPLQAKWQAQNIKGAQVLGIEDHLKLKINKYLTLDSNYTYVNKQADGQGYLYKYGPNYIKHLFNAVFSFNLPFGVQGIELTYKKKPARDGWFLLNTRLSYNLNKRLQIFLKATNLLGVKYEEIVGIPQPGRWVEGGVRFDW